MLALAVIVAALLALMLKTEGVGATPVVHRPAPAPAEAIAPGVNVIVQVAFGASVAPHVVTYVDPASAGVGAPIVNPVAADDPVLVMVNSLALPVSAALTSVLFTERANVGGLTVRVAEVEAATHKGQSDNINSAIGCVGLLIREIP